eukprot:830736-Rhodomonas_salina.6
MVCAGTEAPRCQRRGVLGSVLAPIVLRVCYAMSGTDVGRPNEVARLCPVLRTWVGLRGAVPAHGGDFGEEIHDAQFNIN